MTIERIARGRREADAESGDGFAVEAAIFEIAAGGAALGCVIHLAGEKCGRFAMHFYERGALLILAALFGRTFARGGHRDTAFFGDNADGIGKCALFHFHHEFEDVAADAAAEAVINLLHRMNGERGSLFRMERAEAAEVLARLFQADVFADYADDVRLLFHAIGE